MSTSSAPSTSTDERAGFGFWIGVVIGAAVITFGIRGLVTEIEGERVRSIAVWIVGAGLAHDFILAPIAITVGWLLARIRPEWLRVPATSAGFATGVVLLVSWAPWRGYGRAEAPGNPSVLPLDYATAILTVLAAVWLAAAIWAGVRRHQSSRH